MIAAAALRAEHLPVKAYTTASVHSLSPARIPLHSCAVNALVQDRSSFPLSGPPRDGAIRWQPKTAGKTPLDIAIEYKHPEIARIFNTLTHVAYRSLLPLTAIYRV